MDANVSDLYNSLFRRLASTSLTGSSSPVIAKLQPMIPGLQQSPRSAPFSPRRSALPTSRSENTPSSRSSRAGSPSATNSTTYTIRTPVRNGDHYIARSEYVRHGQQKAVVLTAVRVEQPGFLASVECIYGVEAVAGVAQSAAEE